VELHGQHKSQNREERNVERWVPSISQRIRVAESKEGSSFGENNERPCRSLIPWEIEPISSYRHFGVQGIIKGRGTILAIRSKSRKPKLGDRWHVLVALE
jgi:hypothetical protein